jgi:hypothetical protein
MTLTELTRRELPLRGDLRGLLQVEQDNLRSIGRCLKNELRLVLGGYGIADMEVAPVHLSGAAHDLHPICWVARIAWIQSSRSSGLNGFVR